MKYFILFIFLIAATPQLMAQVDGPTGGIPIPKKKKNAEPQKPSLSNEGTFTIKPEKKPSYPLYQIGGPEEQKSPMSTETRFVSRGPEFEDRVEIKQKRESSEPYKGNQFFGEYRSTAVYVQVMCRDFEYPDGDLIQVMVNDKVVIPEVLLVSDYKALSIPLEKGFNKIDFVALNQGTSGPNTAEFVVIDDKEQTITRNQWNLATGFKATVMLVKE